MSTAYDVAQDNDGVSVVRDTDAYLRNIHASKGREARWVRGLAPEDEESERETARAREELAAAERERAFMMQDRDTERRPRQWLRRPILVGIFYLCALLLTYRSKESFAELMTVDFPESEERVWALARRSSESGINFILRAGTLLAVPSFLAALFAGWLCFLLGSAAHHFTTLCGVGTALLSVLGLIGQLVMLWCACDVSPISNRRECDVPFVLYWMCSLARVGGPVVALWCAGPIMDIARRSHHLKYVLALPVAVLAFALLFTMKDESRATRLFQLVYELQMLTWVVLIAACWGQPMFSAVVTEIKPHTD